MKHLTFFLLVDKHILVVFLELHILVVNTKEWEIHVHGFNIKSVHKICGEDP